MKYYVLRKEVKGRQGEAKPPTTRSRKKDLLRNVGASTFHSEKGGGPEDT